MKTKTGYKGWISELMSIMHQLKQNPVTLVGMSIIMALVFAAVLAPIVAPYPQDAEYAINIEKRLLPPSFEHPLGTDHLGRDILSRIIFGTRISLIVGVITVLVSLSMGVVLGLISGYFGGMIDEIIMRMTDAMLSIPTLVLALAVAATLGPGLTTAMLAIAITWWPWYARLVRAQTLSLKEWQFVEAAKSIGVNHARLMFSHILPNCMTPVIVQASLDVGYAILTAAALGFLGIGAQPPMPEWGLMVGVARKYFPLYWWYPLFPGFAIFVAVLGFNLVGDGFRDLLDPKSRRMIRRW